MATKESEVNGNQESENGSEQDQNLTQDSQENSQNVEVLDGSVTEGQFEFSHPVLKGKSPEEIERFVKLQEATIREQRVAVENARREQQSVERGRQDPNREREEKPSAKDFYEDPIVVLEKTMERMIAPLREEIRTVRRTQGEKSPREKMREKYTDFTTLEPAIDAMIASFGGDPKDIDENLLETVFHATWSKAYHTGHITPENGAPNTRKEKPMNIPQNRPSPAPTPQQRKVPVQRELSENERRLAREYFPDLPTDKAIAAYIELQDEEPTGVIHSKAGKE